MTAAEQREAMAGLLSAIDQIAVAVDELRHTDPLIVAADMQRVSDYVRSLLQSAVCDAYVLTHGSSARPQAPLPECCAVCHLYARDVEYCAPMVAHVDDVTCRPRWCPIEPIDPTAGHPSSVRIVKALRARGLLRPYWFPEP